MKAKLVRGSALHPGIDRQEDGDAGGGADQSTPPRRRKRASPSLWYSRSTRPAASATTCFELQKQGYAAAFRNPQVLNAILSLSTQSIAVTMMQWTGPTLHVRVIEWTLLKDKAEPRCIRCGNRGGAAAMVFGGGTIHQRELSNYSRLLLAASPYRAERRVIDISGDGSNNRGRSVTAQARDEAVHDGIGINGLAILALESDAGPAITSTM